MYLQHLHPNSTPFTISDFKNIINRLPKPFILLRDFNSRNTARECNHTDTRGKTIEQLVEDEDLLILLNNGDPTRYNSSNRPLLAIDLTITNSNMAISLD